MLTVVRAGLLVATALSSHEPPAGAYGEAAAAVSSARTRPFDPLARSLLADGARRSPDFASLLSELDRHTDFVVYVTTRAVDLSTKGALRFVARDRWLTYVIACVDPRQLRDERIAVLGHELRHATEVAAASAWLSSEADLRRLYRHIGFTCEGGVESDAALATQKTVRRELARANRRDVDRAVARLGSAS